MIPKDSTFIWGAGKWGRLAYTCYQNSCNIVGYIDKNEKLYGTEIGGVPVYSPEILKTREASVLIAVSRGVDEIKRCLREEYGIKETEVFRMMRTLEDTDTHINNPLLEDSLVVKFQGGLGNQMFQYALYKLYQEQGKNVTADLSFYLGVRSLPGAFRLSDVFSLVNVKKCLPAVLFHYERYVDKASVDVYYQEPILPEIVFNHKVLGINSGIVEGYFQSYKYPEMVKNDLMSEFVFSAGRDNMLDSMISRVKQKESVAVHVRRGDYTGLISVYGELWNENYYERALEYIKSQVSEPVFLFFSDDIEWTKEHFYEKNAVYIDASLFDKYEDWYDMCLMSNCKHNIIANSTFSWWGAWLNPNPDKIVIAPKNWMKDDVMQDVCPPEWIRL